MARICALRSLPRFLFDQAQHRQGERLGVADRALAAAARADHGAGFFERWAQALARHFQQAEARDAADLHARTVGFSASRRRFSTSRWLLACCHVDEVDHDQATDVAQAQLARDLVGRFAGWSCSAVSSMSRPLVARAELMSIDTSASVGSITIEPPDGSLHLALVRGLDLALDLVAVEQRHRVLVQLHLAAVVAA